MSFSGLIWTEWIIAEHVPPVSLTTHYMPRTSHSCSSTRSISQSLDGLLLFSSCRSAVLLFCHKFHILLYLSAFSHSVAFPLLLHSDPISPQSCLRLLVYMSGVILESLRTADLADYDVEFWAVPSELGISLSFFPLAFLLLYFSHHMGCAVTAPQPHTSVSFRRIIPSKTM